MVGVNLLWIAPSIPRIETILNICTLNVSRVILAKESLRKKNSAMRCLCVAYEK